MEALIPGIASLARGYTDVIEHSGAHESKAGPCVRFHGLEQFAALRAAHGRLPDRLAAGQGSRRRCAHQGHDSRGAGLPRMSDARRPIVQTMDVDIVCVGFGPATAGFLTTLSRHLMNADGTPAIESPSNPGLPLQVMCYERADDIGFGVSGVVTRARGIRASLPGSGRQPDSDGGHRERGEGGVPARSARRQPPVRRDAIRRRRDSRAGRGPATTPWNCPTFRPSCTRKAAW